MKNRALFLIEKVFIDIYNKNKNKKNTRHCKTDAYTIIYLIIVKKYIITFKLFRFFFLKITIILRSKKCIIGTRASSLKNEIYKISLTEINNYILIYYDDNGHFAALSRCERREIRFEVNLV